MRERVSTLSLFALGVNGIVGVGIFFTPNLVAGLVPGAAGSLVFLLTAALLLPIAVTFSVLGRALPVDGGPYVWARAAFGDGAAFAVGWVAAVSALLSTAAVVAGLRDHLAPALGIGVGPFRAVFAGGVTLLLASVASLGLRPSAFTWDALTLLKLLPLLLLLVLAFSTSTPSAAPLNPVVSSFSSWQRAALLAMFSLQGFEAVPVLAGSARRAHGGLPLATIGSLLFAAALYVTIHLGCARALPDLPQHQAPLADAARALGGGAAGSLVSSGTLLSALGTAFGMVVVTPRYVAALGGEAGFGDWLGREDARGVPRLALGLTALVVAVLSSVQALGSLFALSSAAVLAQYAMAIASLLRLSVRGKAPRWAVVPACLGVLTLGLLVKAVELTELWILSGALLLGGVLALARARTRSLP
ncbi:MAG TPA: APC family permease [Polyangiaceae bacterium]|nr:APC family permease [Polyangiaceae bacterium]